MPCFNCSETVETSVRSILGQTLNDFELVAIDDGSTDASGEILERLASADARMRVVRSVHVGIVEALRTGCALATGEYIARMDADDVAHPERLARQLAYLDARPEVACCGTRVSSAGSPPGTGMQRYLAWLDSVVTPEQIARELFVECPIPHPTFMIRRSVYESVGGYNDRGWPEDYDLVMRCFVAGFQIGKVDAVLLEWRDSPRRLSKTADRYHLDKFRRLKRHYFESLYPNDGQAFYQWGAGEVGKAWLREWKDNRPSAVVDVNPRKIGKRIHGVDVIAPADLPDPGDVFVAVAVGAPGARDDIRAWFDPRGYVEQRDYLFVA